MRARHGLALQIFSTLLCLLLVGLGIAVSGRVGCGLLAGRCGHGIGRAAGHVLLQVLDLGLKAAELQAVARDAFAKIDLRALPVGHRPDAVFELVLRERVLIAQLLVEDVLDAIIDRAHNLWAALGRGGSAWYLGRRGAEWKVLCQFRA